MGSIPARYIGSGGELGPGKYYNADGSLRKQNTLIYGDVLMMNDEDVLGKTLWHDPAGLLRSRDLGLGRVVMSGDEDKSPEELARIGYEFHLPRIDFEALPSQEPEALPPQESEEMDT